MAMAKRDRPAVAPAPPVVTAAMMAKGAH
jgi:hypothetical protein